MARSSSRPQRTLAIFFLAIIAMYGLVALAGSWKPAWCRGDARGGSARQWNHGAGHHGGRPP